MAQNPTEKPLVELPAGGNAVTVKLINSVNFGPAVLQQFMGPPVPGLESIKSSPSFSFLLEHPSGRRLLFDLGIRKDYNNHAPGIAGYIANNNFTIEVTHNVVDILKEADIEADSIEAVIWSHWHWDHTGDPSTFPATTDLVVGPGFKAAMLPGAPANPNSPILESDYAGRNLREIQFDGPESLRIGHLPAYDYFGDGSFYILDTPGHTVGHLCGLARTTHSSSTASGQDTFVLLGGDACHYAGVLRPSQHVPMPHEIRPHPCSPGVLQSCLCPGSAFAELQQSRGKAAGEALYDITFGDDLPLAKATLGYLQEFDCLENVFIIISHDCAIRDAVPHFPESVNDWKARGFGESLRWAFLKDLEHYWKTKGLA